MTPSQLHTLAVRAQYGKLTPEEGLELIAEIDKLYRYCGLVVSTCEICGCSYFIGPRSLGGRRPDAITCSDSCRQKRARANQLARLETSEL